jgi:2-polyprenyl-3-methyl-5-hydroxy-6-metoxy-1,4-benzoquinol methylase
MGLNHDIACRSGIDGIGRGKTARGRGAVKLLARRFCGNIAYRARPRTCESMDTNVPPAPLKSPAPALPLKSSGACWICGASDWDRVFTDVVDLKYFPALHPYDHGAHPPIYLVRCRSCGFGQPESMPDHSSYFDAIYQKSYSDEVFNADFETPYRDVIYRTILRSLGRYLRPETPRTLLDVGASTGRFVYLASQAGWEAEGAETDKKAAAVAARRSGRPIHTCRAQELALDGRFGALTLNDVLEHIPQPSCVVASLRPLLAPGGVLAIKVPHGPPQRWKESLRGWIHHDREKHRVGVMTNFTHVNHFTPRSMKRMLEGAGYRVLEITVGAPEYHVGPRKPKAILSNVMRWSAYQLSRWIPGGLYSPMAFNLQVYACPEE